MGCFEYSSKTVDHSVSMIALAGGLAMNSLMPCSTKLMKVG
jgi:hypothetical protein